jgi:hypothetical protein
LAFLKAGWDILAAKNLQPICITAIETKPTKFQTTLKVETVNYCSAKLSRFLIEE